MNSKIFDNVNKIKEGIAEALIKANRPNDKVQILCASKNRSIDELFEVKSAGVDVFGENRVQEFTAKYNSALTWDIIGQLQTNKVKYVIGKVRLIQSLDRMSLAQEIERIATKHEIIQECLVEINTGAEEAKGGLLLPDVGDFVNQLQDFEHIKVVGLMAVAPKSDEDTLRRLFSSVTEEFYRIKSQKPDFSYISMGMSNDYNVAVECGANLIRPGKLIFN